MKTLPLLPLALVLSACAISPESRIERDPQGFAALPTDQQERVRGGEVGMGFSPAAVRLAYGEPDRVVERETSEGKTEVWQYLAPLPVAQPPSYCLPGFRYVGVYPCPVLLPTQYEERARVVFKEGVVIAVERAR